MNAKTPPSRAAEQPGAGERARFPHVGKFARVAKFGVVSGVGLCIDFIVSVSLREAGLSPGIANFCGATIAVTFVFFASIRRVFDADPKNKGRKYALYLGYQALAVPAASALIHALTPPVAAALSNLAPDSGALTQMLTRPATAFFIAKCVVTPLTFYANFVFMGWLLTGRLRWI